jgi:hypothetical protein
LRSKSDRDSALNPAPLGRGLLFTEKRLLDIYILAISNNSKGMNHFSSRVYTNPQLISIIQ